MAAPGPAQTGGMMLSTDGRWTWTEATYQILGFRTGDVPATTAVLLTHVHPHSRAQAARLLDPANRGLIGGSLTLLDARGQERAVVLTGAGSDQGLVLQIVDVTEEYARSGAESRAAAVRAATSARSAIDQTVGALRIVYGMAEPEAFELLSWASQRSGIKLRLLAERVTERLADTEPLPTAQRRGLDRVLFRAMENQPEEAGRLPVGPLMSTARESVPGLCIVAASGELDVRSAPAFTGDLTAALSGLTVGDVLVVDLTDADHVGAVAISVLEGLTRRCGRQQVNLRVVLPEPQADGVDGLRRAGATMHLALGEALSG